MRISPVAVIVIVLWIVGFLTAIMVRRTPAVLCAGMMCGFLFLPQFSIDLPGLQLGKQNLLMIVTAAYVSMIATEHLPRFRLHILDLPLIGYMCSIYASSLSNGLGSYDGCVGALANFLIWGLPWFIGRIVFASPLNALVLARWVVLGALIYLPFCLIEMRLAPTLHATVYGYTLRKTAAFMRYGFWRPTVFMDFGLQLALFMGIASIVALWASITGKIHRVWHVATKRWAISLGVLTVFCVGTGAIILTVVGWILVLRSRSRLQRIPLLALGLLPILYPLYRMANVGQVSAVEVSEKSSEIGNRLQSLNTRILNEEKFLSRWQQRPWLGWTGRYYSFDKGEAIADSLWIQKLAKNGIAGWSCVTAMMLLPCLRSFWRLPVHGVDNPQFVFAVCVVIFMLDCLANAMENPVYVLMAGSIVSMPVVVNDVTSAGNSVSPVTASPRVARSLWPRSVESAIEN